MFEIGFGELLLVAIVALLVVGPERLPRLARTAGLWIGKGRRLVASVRADIERELRAEELKSILDKQARSNPLEEIIEETKDAVHGSGAALPSGTHAASEHGGSAEGPPKQSDETR